MNKHTWNQLSENTQNSLNEAPKKFTKRDFAKLSTEELELLSMGATMFASKGGPVISPDNIHFMTPEGLKKTLQGFEKEKRNLAPQGKKLLDSISCFISS